MPGYCVTIADPRHTFRDFEHDFIPTSGTTVHYWRSRAAGHVLNAALLTRFPKHGGWFEDEHAIGVLDGVVLNAEELMHRRNVKDFSRLCTILYAEKGDAFFSDFRGEFCGVYCDKVNDKWILFTNQTGSKPLYFYAQDGLLICATSLPCVAAILRHMCLNYSLDEVAAYALLSYGYMLADWTLVKEVRKLEAGNYLTVKRGKLERKRYHHFKNEPSAIIEIGAALECIEERFQDSCRLGFSVDRDYGYKPVCALSAGLDCRMVSYAASKFGFFEVLQVNYAQTGSADERYARKVCRALGHEMLFLPLDGGNYLAKTLDGMFEANGGLVTYAGASHTLSMCRNLSFEKFGLFHSGILGDALLGNYLGAPLHVAPKSGAGAYSSKLLNRIALEEKAVLDSHPNVEMFLLYNRGFNGIHNGTWVANRFTVMYSPYLNPEFVNGCLSIASQLRFTRQLRVEWICKHHPRAAAEPYGATGFSVSASRYCFKPLNLLMRVMYKAVPSLCMNPFDHWFVRNGRLRAYYAETLRNLLPLLESHQQLQCDADELYAYGTVNEKALVLTLVNAYKHYFVEPVPVGVTRIGRELCADLKRVRVKEDV